MQQYDSVKFLGLANEVANVAELAVGILPVPYDLTATWKKGAAVGPAAILQASSQVEFYDIETASEPHLHGIETYQPVTCDDGPEVLAKLVEEATANIIKKNQLPVILGGEHSVSIGAIHAVATAFQDLTILQIDAHADTRESYEGSTHNHACVMARAREQCDIMQVGIRSMDASEVAAIETDRILYAHEILSCSNDAWIDRIMPKLSTNVYITIDLDAFDPAYVPATGTPEPGGLTWLHVNKLIKRVAASHRIVGFDVVELLPMPQHHASDFFAAKLVHRILAEIFQYKK